MRLRAALVGCGAMSRAWLEAAAKIAELRDRRPGRPRRCPRRGSRRGIWSRRRRHRRRRRRHCSPRRRRIFCSTSSCRRRVTRSCRPASGAGCHVLSEKPMAETLDEARDLVARAAARTHPRRRAKSPLHRRRAPHRPRDRARARSATVTSIHADFFLAPAFRRLPRGDGARPAARYGDPQLRRHAVHDGADGAGRLLPRVESAELLVPPRLVGVRDLRPRRWRGIHLSRQLVRRGLATSWECAWRFVGVKGALTVGRPRRSFASRASAPASARACSTDSRRPRGAAARPGRPDRRACRRHDGFRRCGRSGTASRKPSAATTSRASRWRSARSRAPRAGRRVEIAI